MGQGWEEDDGSQEKRSIMLLRMELPSGFYPSERAVLESDFMNALLSTGTLHVVNRNDMQDIVQELKFQASDLVDQERAVELGRIMGVGHFVTLSVRNVHGQYQVTARMINVETGEMEKIVVRRSDNRFDYLPALCNEIAYDLAGIEDRKGIVQIGSKPSDAEVFLFGISKGESPVTLRLAPGPYLFTVKKYGYRDRRKTLQVRAGEETAWSARLVKKEKRRLRDYIGGKSVWGTD